MIPLVQERNGQPFDEVTEDQHDRQAQRNGHGQVAGLADQPVSQIGADHIKRAVGKINDAHDAKNQGQPAGHQKQGKAVLNAVKYLNKEGYKIHEKYNKRS